MRLAILFVAVMALSSASHASTISFTCSFSVNASPSGLKKESKPFELRFVADPQAVKAYLIGNNGSSEVKAVGNKGDGMTFIETTDTGNIMVTAITASGEAVHSRNGIMNGKLIPSQYYGKCIIQ